MRVPLGPASLFRMSGGMYVMRSRGSLGEVVTCRLFCTALSRIVPSVSRIWRDTPTR
jgi:hypothetical protein